MALKIDAAVYSHIGHRANNEDNFYFNGIFMERAQMNKGGRLHKAVAGDTQIYAVCDGMGGAEYGEEASFRAVEALKGFQDNTPHPDNTKAINGMVAALSESIDQFSLEKGLRSGDSGSTLAMLVIKDWFFRTVNVGDSRVYLLRDGALRCVTRDDSVVQELVDRGDITLDEAWQHPRKNVITKHLGMPTNGAPLRAAIGERQALQTGDRFIICSDGLSDALHDTMIAEIAGDQTMTAEAAAERLAQTAVSDTEAAGIASDNITVIVLDIIETNSRDIGLRRMKQWGFFRAITCAGALASLCGLVWSAYHLVRLLTR